MPKTAHGAHCTTRVLRMIGLVAAAALALSVLPAAAGAAAGPRDGWLLHDATTGRWSLPDARSGFYYGDPSDLPVLCDWNGDGIDTVGLYRSSTGFLHLRYSNDQGFSDVQIFYGVPEDLPVCGDWDGDGTDTIGVYRPSQRRFFLRNSNTQGFAEVEFSFPAVGRPLAGDWDGDGIDTVGIHTPGTATVAVAAGHRSEIAWQGSYGQAGDVVLAGDWDGDGSDNLGAFRSANRTLFLAGGGSEPGRRVALAGVGVPVAGHLGAGVTLPRGEPEASSLAPDGYIVDPEGDLTVVAGEPVEFRGVGRDPDGHEPLAFRWTFGTGQGAGEGPEPGPVVFAEPGEYVVRLQVTDTTGLADPTPDTRRVTVISRQAAADEVYIPAGENVQAVVDSNPDATRFVLGSGVHWNQTIRPRDGQTFRGEPGTVLTGARRLSGFQFDGRYWYASGQYQQGRVAEGPSWKCREWSQRCVYPEDLWMDGRLFFHASSYGELGAGRWYFDYDADRIYVGEDPGIRLVETSVTESAFTGGARGVTVRDLVIEKYANPPQVGAIDSRGGDTFHGPDGVDWTVDNVEIRHVHGAAIHLTDGGRVLNSYLHHNGQQGITARGTGLLIEGNEIAYNNTATFHYDWEAGGTKFYRSHGLVVRNNHIHHNANAAGLWVDLDNYDMLMEGNRIEFNDHEGIYVEISHDAVVRNNYLEGNGWNDARNHAGWAWGAAIEVSSSDDVEIYGNTLVDNNNHIVGIEQQRGYGEQGEPLVVERMHVHDNHVTATRGYTGLVTDYGDGSFFTGRGNRFENNTYVLDPNAHLFHWQFRPMSFWEWQAHGQDTGGTVLP